MTRLLAFAALVLGACTDLSAPSNGRDCYGGETCSNDTPEGLEFQGVARIAIGGTARVVVLDAESSTPFALPYTTDTSRPTEARFGVTTEVVAREPGEITVRGLAEGSNYLRVLAPDGALYDRTVLSAAAVESRRLRPRYAGPEGGDSIVWASGSNEILVELRSAAGPAIPDSFGLLVDESLTLAMPGATQTAWNTVRVPAAAAGHRTLVISGGSGDASLDLETVDAPDTIKIGPDNAYPLVTTGTSKVCFVARHGTRYVAGARWSLTMDGGQVTTNPLLDTPDTGCAELHAFEAGTVRIHVTASGFTQTFEIVAQ